MGLYGSAPKPPNYKPLAKAQEKLGDRAMDIMERQYDIAREQGEKLFSETKRVNDVLLQQMREQADFAREERDRYKKTYRPREDAFLREVDRFDTPQRRNQAAGRAMSEVGQQFNAARENAERRLEGFGIDPSMIRGGALDLETRIAESAVKAQASTSERTRIEDEGRRLRMAAIDMGRGIPVSSSTAATGAVQSGSGGSSALIGGVGGATGAMTGAQGWGQVAGQGYGGAANALNMGYNNALGAYEANQKFGLPGILSSVAGGMGGALASKYFSEGGRVPEEMSPTRGALPDDVDIKVTAGEYVVPDDVVRFKGEEFFLKLKKQVAAAREEQAQQGVLR